jgi:DEAD/DEAH box helicase domain-containing protein
MDVAAFLSRIEHHPSYVGQISHVELLPERPGKFAEPAEPLPAPIAEMLARRGIERLYSHQVASLEHARAGRDFVVVTGTASGKTLCYHLPILGSCHGDPEARALYLFPTKALAQDQLKNLLELLNGECGVGNGESQAFAHARKESNRYPSRENREPILFGDAVTEPQDARPLSAIAAGVYDGDTPTAQRRRIKAEANLVLSNPDMLHASILPYHPKFGRFFSELKFVVLDEVHTYRGILGAHVACVLRRLIRVCEHYGSRPVFIATSATIANPGELTAKLIGRPVEVVTDDGAPRGRKFFALWNPEPIGNDRLARRSAADDAVMLMVEAVESDAQALTFTRTRQAAELVHRYTRDQLDARRSRHADSVRAYRGGYLPLERRAIEQDLFAGRLRAVAATNALELGLDIGSLDIAILAGYPGTIASTWQQAGRSGRRHDESLAVLIAGNDPVDQYLLRHPDYFFRQTPEQAVVDPENPYVLARHVKAAAFEIPLGESDLERFGRHAAPIAAALRDAGELAEMDGRFFYTGTQNPTVGVSLRHMSDNTFSIVLRKPTAGPGTTYVTNSGASNGDFEVIANVDSISAPELVYPEAVYLHNGESYFVRQLDLDGKVAYVERHEMDYYTQAVLESAVKIRQTRDEHDAAAEFPFSLAYGDVDVTWQTVAFKKIKFGTRENIGQGPVNIPAQTLPTTSFWLCPRPEVRAQMKIERLRATEGLVGLRNLAVVALPLVAMCDSRDLGGVVDSTNLGHSTLIVYDRYPGGLGYSERGFARIEELLRICHEMLADCECEQGCPSCVGLPNLRPAIHSDPDLTRGYPMPNKRATLRLLELLRGSLASAQPIAQEV